MKRAPSNDLGSLELLLDTMCNTFGGVVFIAMLLCILSQNLGVDTSEPERPTPADTPELVALKGAEAERLRHRVELLSTIIRQREQMRLDATPATIVTEPPRPVPRIDLTALKERLTVAEKELRTLQEKLNEDLVLKEVLEKQARLLEDQAKKRVAEERVLRLPRLHRVQDKKTVLLAIRGKKLYTVSDLTALDGYNTADVAVQSVVVAGNQTDVVTLRPDRGQPLAAGAGKGDGVFREMLTRLDPAKVYLSVGVAPDSFPEFNQLKTRIVEKRFDYSWQPLFADKLGIRKTNEDEVQ